MNDNSWTLEEQYFNSTLSVADKGDDSKGLIYYLLDYPSHVYYGGNEV